MTIEQFIIYVLLAAVVGLIAERLVGSGPWGLIGTIVVGLLGIWVMLNLLHWRVPGDPVVGGVPIFTALIGAIIVDLILTFLIRSAGPRRGWRRRV